ncbi:MAG: hypothetical protein LC708_02780 [Actinobacteria bacterium]|nr:hypothetical protein [Actinomycetota bacterium]
MQVRRDEQGQGAIMLVAVTLVLVVAVFLLIRTTTLASQIDGKATNIAKTGRGINSATDAILQLAQTNELGTSILETSKPLVPNLAKIVDVAGSIDRLAGSINGTAVEINGTAKGINATAGGITTTLQSINNGVETINRNVDVLLGLAKAVKADTTIIVGQGQLARKLGSCINSGLPAHVDPNRFCK